MLGGPSNLLGGAVDLAAADERIFGYVLLNDWSARDIQSWEMVPLGPFNGKNWATTVSAWIVTAEAMEPWVRSFLGFFFSTFFFLLLLFEKGKRGKNSLSSSLSSNPSFKIYL